MTTGPAVAALLVLATGLLLWPSPGDLVSRRARRLLLLRRSSGAAALGAARWPIPRDRPRRRSSTPAGPGRRWLLAVAAAAPLGALVGGTAGLVAAAVVATAVERLLRHRPDAGARERQRLTSDLPVACDLLAACLAAGVPVLPALAGVGTAVGGPLGESLTTVAGLLRLGAEPRTAWADTDPELAPLARLLTRTAETGAAASGALRALAADTRAVARGRAEAGVRRAGVWVLAPLGACFLPAFLCLGVVPLVLGIAADVFG